MVACGLELWPVHQVKIYCVLIALMERPVEHIDPSPWVSMCSTTSIRSYRSNVLDGGVMSLSNIYLWMRHDLHLSPRRRFSDLRQLGSMGR